MSKKRPKASKSARPPVGEIVAARAVLEQAWTYDRRIVDGMTWQMIRALALRPDELGGIGRNYGIATLKGLVAAHRAEQGEIVGTREERIERRQHELDELALLARASIARAAAGGVVKIDGELVEIPPRLDEKAAKVLLVARAAEAKMHGDDAAQRVDVDVTTHDAVLDELNAALVAMGEEPVRAEP